MEGNSEVQAIAELAGKFQDSFVLLSFAMQELVYLLPGLEVVSLFLRFDHPGDEGFGIRRGLVREIEDQGAGQSNEKGRDFPESARRGRDRRG